MTIAYSISLTRYAWIMYGVSKLVRLSPTNLQPKHKNFTLRETEEEVKSVQLQI